MNQFQKNRRLHSRIISRTQKYLLSLRSQIVVQTQIRDHFQKLYNNSGLHTHLQRKCEAESYIKWLHGTIDIINSLDTSLPKSHILEVMPEKQSTYDTAINICHQIYSRIQILYNTQTFNKLFKTI
jgi:hypothetical protein